MYLEHLSLANLRNLVRLELDLPQNIGLLIGENGQGKSNLLEAIAYLATTRSYRAGSDRELINWLAGSEPLPHARLVARVQRQDGPVQLEITLLGQPEVAGAGQIAEDDSLNGRLALFQASTSSLQKKIRVNGVPRRAIDAIGQVNVVMFGPQDLDLVSGAPALRRRYLDATLCQTNRRYTRSLQRYHRVVMHRNHLLRRIARGDAHPDELAFWDEQLIEHGSYIVDMRQQAVSLLSTMARDIHIQLTDGQERLRIVYRATVQAEQDLTEAFRSALAQQRARDLQAGMSLIGPHRDDLVFFADGIDMRVYGSRGQQRTVALSLKFAEARYICGTVGEEPILLLDDIMSELDGNRRRWVLGAIEGGGQVLITNTDTAEFAPSFLEHTTVLRVRGGVIEAA